jgi:hypothetical protein
MSILDFSWPEVSDSPFKNDPSTYAEILKQLIKLFIKFMIEYVQTNNPVDVQLVEAFLKRMAYIWGNFSDSVLRAAPGWYGPGFDPVWNTEQMHMAVSVSSEESDKMNKAKANGSFYDFSRKFYEIFDAFKYKGETVYFHAIMRDLNKLICIVLLGGYVNIDYYIDKPAYTVPGAQVKMEHDVIMIDARKARSRMGPQYFSQVGHQLSSDYVNMIVENMPIPLFVKLAAFIVKHPEALSQLNDDAVDKAVDRAVSEATEKLHGGRRTRHKRSGHKRSGKRSNKRSDKRSGHKKRSGKRSGHKKRSGHMSRRR